MQKKNILLIIIIIIIAAIFIVFARITKKPASVPEEKPKPPINVTVQNSKDSTTFKQNILYPATVVGDQEVKISAKSAGTAAEVNFSLGDKVAANALLVKIDDTGNTLEIGDNGFRSSQIQQSHLSVEQAEEQLELYKKTYRNLKNAYDAQKKNPALTKTVTKAQLTTAKEQIDIGEVQLENAKVGLKGGLDNHLITSPIGGFITNKSVSMGDSITLNQEIATISKTTNMKIQFFIDQSQLTSVTKGLDINVADNNGNSFSATVKNISPDADGTTKRFLVEAFPKEQNPSILLSGTIVTVSFTAIKTPKEPGDLLLPLSAIIVGQNESYLFLAANDRARKLAVKVQNVEGEIAEIKGDIPSNVTIIVSGSKLVQDGDSINVQ